MIKLNVIEITEEQFKEIAEREGYVKAFEYPLYMEANNMDKVVKFTSTGSGHIRLFDGTFSEFETVWYKHTDPTVWKPWQPHEELKKQYAEDSKATDEPWLLWEVKCSVWLQCVDKPEWKVERQYRRKETKTYDGLTLEQLDQAMDEGLLFEFWNVDATKPVVVHTGLMDILDAEALSPYFSNSWWRHCRIHRAFPQFVIDGKKPDWLADNTFILIQYKGDSRAYTDCTSNADWINANRFQVVGL